MADSITFSESLVSCSLANEETITNSQLATSQMIQSFCAQAVDGYSLCGMIGASLFASIARVKCSRVLSLFIQDPKKAFLIKGGSAFAACLAEATGIHSIPKILKEREIFGGRVEEGWGGWIHTSLTMIIMKGSGLVLPPNLILQHLAQDALMVKFDEVCVSFHLIEGQQGSFIEKMASAELMNCQMMVSGALIGICFSEIKSYEAKQDLKYEMSQRGSFHWKAALSGLFKYPEIITEFAMEGGGKLSFHLSSLGSEKSWEKKGSNHLFSTGTPGENSLQAIHELYQQFPSAKDTLKRNTGSTFEECIEKTGNEIPKDWQLETLDTLSLAATKSLSKLLAHLPPDAIRSNLGEDTYWFTLACALNYGGFETFLSRSHLSKKDEQLLKIARTHFVQSVRIPTSFKIKTFKLFKYLLESEILERELLDSILESCAIGSRLSKKMQCYHLEGIWTGYPGWPGSIVGKWAQGSKTKRDKDWDIALDGSVGILLLYEGEPSASIALTPAVPNSVGFPYLSTEKEVSIPMPFNAPLLKIRQFQGTRVNLLDPQGKNIERRNPRGLGDLHWKQLLTKVCIEISRRIGFGTVMIQSAHNNPWLYNDDGTVHLPLETALKLYDETAKKLDFTPAEDKNWYKVL